MLLSTTKMPCARLGQGVNEMERTGAGCPNAFIRAHSLEREAREHQPRHAAWPVTGSRRPFPSSRGVFLPPKDQTTTATSALSYNRGIQRGQHSVNAGAVFVPSLITTDTTR